MLQELLAVTATGLNLVNQAAVVSSAALNVVSTTVQATGNLANALEKSTRVVENESDILLAASNDRLTASKKALALASV